MWLGYIPFFSFQVNMDPILFFKIVHNTSSIRSKHYERIDEVLRTYRRCVSDVFLSLLKHDWK